MQVQRVVSCACGSFRLVRACMHRSVLACAPGDFGMRSPSVTLFASQLYEALACALALRNLQGSAKQVEQSVGRLPK